MVASHGTTHKTMHHFAAGSDADGRYSDGVCSPDLSTLCLWLFLEMYGEQRELYFWTWPTSLADQKLAEGPCTICFFQLELLLLISPCVSEKDSPQN